MESQVGISFENTEVAFSYRSNSELRKAHLIFSVVNHPWVSALATGLVKIAIRLRLPVTGLIRNTVFQHFCGGESIEKAEHTIEHLAAFSVHTILDYSVEGEKSEMGFDQTLEEILHTFDRALGRKDVPFCVFKVTGIADASLLKKVQRRQSLSAAEQLAMQKVKERLVKICSRALESGVPVLVDAEETWIQGTIDSMVYEMMMQFNRDRTVVYNTFQMYRTDMLKNLKEAFHNAAMHQYYLGAKLVRGAYMEKERERAKEQGYESPIHPDKEATDAAFNRALGFCVDNKQRISLMCGSHNEYSNYYLTILMQKHSLAPNDPRVWFAQLYGMSDNISFNLAKAGFNVAKYVPYGPVRSVMPYLLRRADENTSVAGQSSRELILIQKELRRRQNLKNN